MSANNAEDISGGDSAVAAPALGSGGTTVSISNAFDSLVGEQQHKMGAGEEVLDDVGSDVLPPAPFTDIEEGDDNNFGDFKGTEQQLSTESEGFGAMWT